MHLEYDAICLLSYDRVTGLGLALLPRATNLSVSHFTLLKGDHITWPPSQGAHQKKMTCRSCQAEAAPVLFYCGECSDSLSPCKTRLKTAVCPSYLVLLLCAGCWFPWSPGCRASRDVGVMVTALREGLAALQGAGYSIRMIRTSPLIQSGCLGSQRVHTHHLCAPGIWMLGSCLTWLQQGCWSSEQGGCC